MKPPEVGHIFRVKETVGEGLVTSHIEGVPPILSTPGLVYLVEKAGDECLKAFMDEGEVSVGVSISLNHIAPTPLGDWIEVEVKVEEVQGSKVSFSFVARDKRGKIAEGKHVRAVVDANRIREKLKKAL